jgi:hypothetical protein
MTGKNTSFWEIAACIIEKRADQRFFSINPAFRICKNRGCKSGLGKSAGGLPQVMKIASRRDFRTSTAEPGDFSPLGEKRSHRAVKDPLPGLSGK